ncbi:signal recognition particle-docking protein FtsY [Corynebacterium timonense]
MDTTTIVWIIIAVVAIVLLIAGLVVAGNRRKKTKTVSFDKVEEPKELTQQEKSGNYQAKGGFNFAQADAQPDLVRRDGSSASGSTAAAAGGAAAASHSDPEPPAPDAPVVEAAAPPTPPEADPETDPVSQPEQQVEMTHDTVDFVESTDPEATEPEAAQPEAPAAPAAEPADEPAEESGEPNEPGETLEQLVDKQRDVEKEAEEAAAAAAVTAEVAEEARQDGAVASEDAIITDHEPSDELDEIAPAAGRIGKLRGRLSRSQNAIGQGLLGILTAGDLDEDAWEEIEDTLIMADLGANLTMKVTDSLRSKIAERGVSSEAEARAMLRETLIEAARPEMDRSLKAMPNDGKPAVIVIVGVNGTGKTTTTGKLARVLVSLGHSVVLGAADTFRAAAADQLETWGRRVGATTVRGKEGADPASVAYDAVATGVDQGADVVLVDTAGRLHTSTGLMDQLGKVKRVVEKKTRVDEVLLVLDATVGQNGITQARVFRDVVDITGVVLTKLDGTAKGGIVFQVQEELGVPVKLVGLGEGADDLAPFEVESFVDALLG